MIALWRIIIKLLVIIIGSVAIIDTAYIWVLPTFFHGYRTYSILVIGASFAALLGGYCCYKTIKVLMSASVRFLLSSFCGVVVATIVVTLATGIIANLTGT